jgi:hypothetical protein
MSPEPVTRQEAESDLSEAANVVRDLLAAKVEPAWLWKRNEKELRQVAEDLELAASSFAFDQPYGNDEATEAAT